MPRDYIPAKHCKNPKCSRLVRQQNKSGYCCGCYRERLNKGLKVK